MKICFLLNSLCLVVQSCPTLCDPMDCSPLGSSVHGDSPGKHTGVDCHALPSGDLSNPGIKPRSPTLQVDSLPSEPPWKPPINPKRNQPWIVIGRTDAEAEAPVLWLPMWRADSLEKILILGKTEGKRRRGWQRMKWLDSITNSADINLNKLWDIVKDRGAWRAAVHRVASASHNLMTEQQERGL